MQYDRMEESYCGEKAFQRWNMEKCPPKKKKKKKKRKERKEKENRELLANEIRKLSLSGTHFQKCHWNSDVEKSSRQR